MNCCKKFPRIYSSWYLYNAVRTLADLQLHVLLSTDICNKLLRLVPENWSVKRRMGPPSERNKIIRDWNKSNKLQVSRLTFGYATSTLLG